MLRLTIALTILRVLSCHGRTSVHTCTELRFYRVRTGAVDSVRFGSTFVCDKLACKMGVGQDAKRPLVVQALANLSAPRSFRPPSRSRSALEPQFAGSFRLVAHSSFPSRTQRVSSAHFFHYGSYLEFHFPKKHVQAQAVHHSHCWRPRRPCSADWPRSMGPSLATIRPACASATRISTSRVFSGRWTSPCMFCVAQSHAPP